MLSQDQPLQPCLPRAYDCANSTLETQAASARLARQQISVSDSTQDYSLPAQPALACLPSRVDKRLVLQSCLSPDGRRLRSYLQVLPEQQGRPAPGCSGLPTFAASPGSQASCDSHAPHAGVDNNSQPSAHSNLSLHFMGASQPRPETAANSQQPWEGPACSHLAGLQLHAAKAGGSSFWHAEPGQAPRSCQPRSHDDLQSSSSWSRPSIAGNTGAAFHLHSVDSRSTSSCACQCQSQDLRHAGPVAQPMPMAKCDSLQSMTAAPAAAPVTPSTRTHLVTIKQPAGSMWCGHAYGHLADLSDPPLGVDAQTGLQIRPSRPSQMSAMSWADHTASSSDTAGCREEAELCSPQPGHRQASAAGRAERSAVSFSPALPFSSFADPYCEMHNSHPESCIPDRTISPMCPSLQLPVCSLCSCALTSSPAAPKVSSLRCACLAADSGLTSADLQCVHMNIMTPTYMSSSTARVDIVLPRRYSIRSALLAALDDQISHSCTVE